MVSLRFDCVMSVFLTALGGVIWQNAPPQSLLFYSGILAIAFGLFGIGQCWSHAPPSESALSLCAACAKGPKSATIRGGGDMVGDTPDTEPGVRQFRYYYEPRYGFPDDIY